MASNVSPIVNLLQRKFGKEFDPAQRVVVLFGIANVLQVTIFAVHFSDHGTVCVLSEHV